MQSIGSLFQNYTIATKPLNDDEEYKAICQEMYEYFPKDKRTAKVIFSLPFKVGNTNPKLRDAFEITKKRKITEIRYLIGVLNKLH